MTRKMEASMEYMAALLKTGTATYPTRNRVPDKIWEDFAAYLASTTGHPGVVELATSAEAIAGSDAVRAVAPSALQAVLKKMVVTSFIGKSGTGSCLATGLAINDIVVSVAGQPGATGALGTVTAKYESTITVGGSIQQTDTGDRSGIHHVAIVLHPA